MIFLRNSMSHCKYKTAEILFVCISVTYNNIIPVEKNYLSDTSLSIREEIQLILKAIIYLILFSYKLKGHINLRNQQF